MIIALFDYLRNFFSDLRIKYKLFISYFFITIMPVAAIGYFSYTAASNYLMEQSIRIISQSQEKIALSIERRLDSLKFLATTMYNNPKLQSLISGEYIGYYEEYELVRNSVEPTIQSLLDATGTGICAMFVRYNDIGSEIIPYNFENILSQENKGINYIDNGRRIFTVINYSRVRDRKWLQDLQGNTKEFKLVQVASDKEFGNISIVKEMVGSFGYFRSKIGLMRMTISLDNIFEKEKAQESYSAGFYMVINSDGTLLSSEKFKVDFFNNNKAIINTYLNSKDNKNFIIEGEFLLKKRKINNYEWTLLSVLPIGSLTENVDKIRQMTLLYIIISTLVLSLITFALSSSFSKRIIKLSEEMMKFKKGNFDVRVEHNSKDELGFLASVFNDMAYQIKTLINQNYKANIDRKDALLKALQAQINPHFLYNSLSAISRLSEFGNNQDINRMVMALTKFYRMTLNKGKDIINIRDEIEQIKAYIEVYKIRMGEKFRVFFDIDETVFQFYTVKVIIQPFVENIFSHAIYDSKHPVNIIISAKQDANEIIFKVIDDGIGIDKKTLKKILSDDELQKDYGGYGIKNVNERIKVCFGDSYGVQIFSIYCAGTCARINIPKIEYYNNQ